MKFLKFLGLGLFLFSLCFLITCSSEPGINPSAASNSNNNNTVIQEIPGKGTPDYNDVRLDVISDSIVTDTLVDTIPITELANSNWDQIIDTLVDSSVTPLDSDVIVWEINNAPLIDTTFSLDSLADGFIITGLPQGTYKLSPQVKGAFKDFYESNDTVLVSDGASPIYFSPVFTPVDFGHIQGYVKSKEDSTPLFNTIRVEIDQDNLEGNNKFETDSTGYFYIPYVPLETVTITVIPKDDLEPIYSEMDTSMTPKQGETIVIHVYL